MAAFLLGPDDAHLAVVEITRWLSEARTEPEFDARLRSQKVADVKAILPEHCLRAVEAYTVEQRAELRKVRT